MNKHGRSIDETAAAVRAIPVIHVHGSLGALDWQNPILGRPYSSSLTGRLEDTVGKAADSIKIIHESSKNKEFQQAREAIAEAVRVVFLGFGYHETNLTRLFGGVKAPAYLQGSCFGMSTLQKENVATILSRLGHNPFDAGHGSHSTLQFLRERVF